MHFLHHISAKNHSCEIGAIKLVGSMSNLDFTLIVCYNLGLLNFSLPKIGGAGCEKFSSQFVKFFGFEEFCVLKYNIISTFPMALVTELNWRQQRP